MVMWLPLLWCLLPHFRNTMMAIAVSSVFIFLINFKFFLEMVAMLPSPQWQCNDDNCNAIISLIFKKSYWWETNNGSMAMVATLPLVFFPLSLGFFNGRSFFFLMQDASEDQQVHFIHKRTFLLASMCFLAKSLSWFSS